ncbi:MAG: IS3 family transposase, partial [Caldisericia bacterium]|nr:IS3 family transposase [Caldisericia bacterium]
PCKGFASIDKAREWVFKFVNLYNTEFLHSGIKYVTPYQRHYGEDIAILNNRREVYREAKLKHPERWSGVTRNWDRIDQVALNPVNDLERSLVKEK